MVEIVFGESAGGSLKVAQSYGKGKYHGGCFGVIVTHEDGSKPTQEEIAQAQREAEERERAAWDNAVPLGGNSKDVFAISFGLSMGDISESFPGEKRLSALRELYRIYPEDAAGVADEMFERSQKDAMEALRRIKAGEKVRIWYSSQPDELCGMYWFMDQLRLNGACDGDIYTVRLPEMEFKEDERIIIRKNSWGDIEPGECHRYIELEQKASSLLIKVCASRWKELQEENASLRAEINGKLMSVREDLYDEYILQELEKQPDEFREARLIGQVLGRYQLGIGDAWVARRVEAMVQAGSLSVAEEAGEGMPSYHRTLRKCR